jgi:polyhydroxyalkanoate synthesis regulator protein
MEWFENAMRMFAPFTAGAAQRGPQVPAPKPGGKDVELEALKEQLAAMQVQLDKLVKDG